MTQGELELTENAGIAYPSPVVGSTKTGTDATSEGVHLYADPEFNDGYTPVLYADCEGMNAGEKPPFALNHLIGMSDHSRKQRLVKKKLQGASREIKWAVNDRKRTDASLLWVTYTLASCIPFLTSLSSSKKTQGKSNQANEGLG